MSGNYSVLVREVFDLVKRYYNPIDKSLSVRHPNTLGFFPNESRDIIKSKMEHAVRTRIVAVKDNEEKDTMKHVLVAFMGNEILFNTIKRTDSRNEFMYTLCENNSDHKKPFRSAIMKSIYDYISTVPNDEYVESLHSEIIDALIRGDIGLAVNLLGTDILIDLENIIMTELQKLPDDKLQCIKEIYICANRLYAMKNTFEQQDDEDPSGSTAAAAASPSHSSKPSPKRITEEDMEKAYEHTERAIKMEYKKMNADQTIMASNRHRGKKH